MIFSRVSYYLPLLEVVSGKGGVSLPLSESLCVFVFSFSVDILEQ